MCAAHPDDDREDTQRRIPDVLERFVEVFNDGGFWDSHEVLEGPWRRTGSDFYHGLILFASAFVHAVRGTPHGIQAQLAKAKRVLDAYRPAYLGIDVDGLLMHADLCRQIVENNADAPEDAWASLIPVPRLEPDEARVRGDEPELEA